MIASGSTMKALILYAVDLSQRILSSCKRQVFGALIRTNKETVISGFLSFIFYPPTSSTVPLLPLLPGGHQRTGDQFTGVGEMGEMGRAAKESWPRLFLSDFSFYSFFQVEFDITSRKRKLIRIGATSFWYLRCQTELAFAKVPVKNY